MICHAVIDTNVLVSALMSKHDDAATVQLLKAILGGRVVPVCCDEILQEYEEILQRPHFAFPKSSVHALLENFRRLALMVAPVSSSEEFIDEDDRVFYECALAAPTPHTFLVTGNRRHYPNKDFILSPRQMLEIL